MHYAEFGEDEVRTSRGASLSNHADDDQSVALREAIKEYEANKWKVIGQKIGKPAKVGQCPLFFFFPLLPHISVWRHISN